MMPVRAPPRAALAALFAAGLATVSPPLDAQETAPLSIATKEAPPFAMERPDGGWEGLSIELWEAVAAEAGLRFDYREFDGVKAMLDAVAAGEVEAAVAAITVTPAREERVDFTHPYFRSGLGLAFATGGGSTWVAVLEGLFSRQFLAAVLTLALVLLVAAAAVWVFERKANPEQFGGGAKGLAESFWWSAVTMTTVGYGDKSPRTLGGRAVAVVWMFASVITISTFTASIASSVTVDRLGDDLLRSRSLEQIRVAVVEGSTGEAYARTERLRPRVFPSLDGAVRAVVEGQADAVLHDRPMLRFLARTSFDGQLEVAERTLTAEDYAVALPKGSERRKTLNVALLKVLGGPEWDAAKARYLGP